VETGGDVGGWWARIYEEGTVERGGEEVEEGCEVEGAGLAGTWTGKRGGRGARVGIEWRGTERIRQRGVVDATSARNWACDEIVTPWTGWRYHNRVSRGNFGERTGGLDGSQTEVLMDGLPEFFENF
jgi:hypothetical protein